MKGNAGVSRVVGFFKVWRDLEGQGGSNLMKLIQEARLCI
jgi:hypothetical protein